MNRENARAKISERILRVLVQVIQAGGTAIEQGFIKCFRQAKKFALKSGPLLMVQITSDGSDFALNGGCWLAQSSIFLNQCPYAGAQEIADEFGLSVVVSRWRHKFNR